MSNKTVAAAKKKVSSIFDDNDKTLAKFRDYYGQLHMVFIREGDEERSYLCW